MEVIIADLTIAPGAQVPKHNRHGYGRLGVIEGGPVTLQGGTTPEFAIGTTRNLEPVILHAGITISGETPIRLITIRKLDKVSR